MTNILYEGDDGPYMNNDQIVLTFFIGWVQNMIIDSHKNHTMCSKDICDHSTYMKVF
jgi:glycosylphosphatidylinositol transamidase (GPIT) subunit GPI8